MIRTAPVTGLRPGAALLALALCGSAMPARADDAAAQIDGTIASMRGNILVIRPTLRHVLTRIVIGDATRVFAYDRAAVNVLRPGMKLSMFGTYSEAEGFHPRWIEAAEKSEGSLQKSEGLKVPPGGGWANATGDLKSVQPFVFTDDQGKEYTGKLDGLRGVWHIIKVDRSNLLIGMRVSVTGKKAPDGVVQALSIAQDRDSHKVGAMFGGITSVQDGMLEVRPRFTQDTLRVTCAPGCSLLRQITLDPDTIKVGDTVTFWGQAHNHPWDVPRTDDLLATALLIGANRYPAAEGDGGGVFLTGRIASLDPVTLALPGGKKIHIIIPAQMPVARLDTIHPSDLKAGAQAMLVLKRGADGGFQATTLILDASPWVGYGE